MAKQLTKADIFGLDDLPRQQVIVPEWNGYVYVRAMTGAERDKLERMISKDAVSRAAIAAFVIVDENGKRLFSDSEIEKLAEKSGTALEKVVNAALTFNALTDEALEAAKND
jgi:hypothetical protein